MLAFLRISKERTVKFVQSIETDVIILGYGRIIKNIISNLYDKNLSIICITNNELAQREINNHKEIQFITRAEAISKNLQSKKALFAWRNIAPLVENSGEFQDWLNSNQFESRQSFLLSSASVYRDSSITVCESQINLDQISDRSGKLLLETSLSDLMKSKSTFHTNLRISNIYGPNLNYGFIAALLDAIQNQAFVEIYEGREIVRDYISISDVVFAVSQILLADFKHPNINISTGKGNSISQVLDIFATYKYLFANRINKVPSLDIKSTSILNCELLSSIIEWKPRDLAQGINEILNV